MNISYTRAARHSLFVRIPFLLLLVSSMMGSNLFAAKVVLTWNPNNEADLAGYNVYKRRLPSNDYGSSIFSGLSSNPAAPQITVNNLDAGTSYGFIATAFDTSGNESSSSNETIVTTLSEGGGGSGGGSFPAPLSTPTPGTTLTNTSITFTGGHTSEDTNHRIYVGTSKGARNLHDSGTMGSSHSTTATGLPTSGTIYVRYWSTNASSTAHGWVYHDHTYTMAVGSGGSGGGGSGGGSFPAPLSTPTPGTTLTNTSITFTGGHTSEDTNHRIYVGTSKGARNLHDSGTMGSSHSTTATGLPTSGTIYVRYWSTNASSTAHGWVYHDHTYTMAVGSGGSGGGGSGGGSFPAPLSTPTPGTTLTNTSITFTGGHTSEDTNHRIYVGTSKGARNLHDSGTMGSSHSTTATGLPTSGTIYVRYWSTNASSTAHGWVYHDHTYTMAVGSGGSGGGSFPAPLSTPTPGTTLTNTSITFTGGHTSEDTNHRIYVGTSKGARNLHDSGTMGSSHSTTATGLPTSGTIYVRYWSTNASSDAHGWVYRDHTYTMDAGGN